MSMIEVQGVSKRFPLRRGESIAVLEDISLDVGLSEFAAIIGPSGCGKSTLLHMVAGLERPTDGAIHINGEAPDALRSRHELGIAFQEHALLPWLTVESNIALPFRIAGRTPNSEQLCALMQLAGLQGFEKAYPRQLSGGMRQRAAIARSLALDPKLLLLDEPFAALDAVTRHGMNIELQRIWLEKRLTTLLVTHSVDEAVFLADRVIIFSGRPGRVLEVIAIPLERPRTMECTRTREFHMLTDHLTALLEPRKEIR
jgi:NitT/TauT family transport system ATP-binding protein